MLKTIFAAIVSALFAHLITQHVADKKVVALHRSYDRRIDSTVMSSYASGWYDGNNHGYRIGRIDGSARNPDQD